MSEWYSIHSFVTTPTSDPLDPTLTDLSAFFNTPAIAETFRRNSGWRLADAHYTTNSVNPMTGWSGTISADGRLIPGSGTPTDLVFPETTSSARYMEIQVSFDPEPTQMCVKCDQYQTTAIKSRTASTIGRYGVELATGRYLFDLPLLSVIAIGAGQWKFGLRYYPDFGISGIVGEGFNYPQYDILREMATIGTGVSDAGGNDIELVSSGNTREIFSYDYSTGGYLSASNNAGAILLRTGEGTTSDTFTLIAADGTVTVFFGLYSGITTPGQMQSVTDRFGNTQTLSWTTTSGVVQLVSVLDSYGRTASYSYYGSEQNYRLQQITDFLGRQVSFQYDELGHLMAAITPSILKAAPGNTFPGGTAYVFQFDTDNSRPERRDDLIKVWYPNETLPYLDADTRTVDVASVYADATPRYQISYGQDPTNTNTYGKVVGQVIGDPTNNVGGTPSYAYTTTGLPANDIDPSDTLVGRTTTTDCNGNVVYFDFDGNYMLSHQVVFANRSKNSLQAGSWTTWTSFNTHNQPLIRVMPEGNSVVYTYEDETNTITFSGVPYARRVGLLKAVTRLPGNSIGVPSRDGSGPSDGIQYELTVRQFIDPLFGQTCASIEERGNPIDPTSGAYFPPQNGGTTPTDTDRSRYATINYFDYQKDATASVQADTSLQAQLALTSTQIGSLIAWVNTQMTATDGTGGLPAGFEMGVGDINGDGTPSFTTITLTGSPTGGTFQLLYGATATANITFTLSSPSTSAAAIQSALLATVGSGSVTVSPFSPPYVFTITVVPASGIALAVSFNPANNFLTGGTSPAGSTSTDVRHQGAVVKIARPSVRQLVPMTGEGDPWQWQTQSRIDLFTSNARGQRTTVTDSEGNLTVYVRFPECDPIGVGDINPALSGQQYGFLREIHSDANPDMVMDLVGLSGDLIDFIPGLIERTNTPGQYLDLVTAFAYSPDNTCAGTCGSSPKPTLTTDPRGYVTTTLLNEIGQVYQTIAPQPYNFLKDFYFDANGNRVRQDTEHQVVALDNSDPTSPSYGQFTLASSHGFTAHAPMEPGPGGSVRPGWFTSLFEFNLLDWKTQDDIDATGSTPSQLITHYNHDPNGNRIETVKPMGNTVENDYDERDLNIAQRVGYDPDSTLFANGAITVQSYDGNGNLLNMIGPVVRGTTSTSLAATIADAFSQGSPLTHTGDYLLGNILDGFDRTIESIDALGNTTDITFDPGSREIQTAMNGPAGGTTPTDRTGASNVPLSSTEFNFDEAGRAYEQQQDVFLNTGISGSTPTHALASTRTAADTGGGLATNSTTNSNTATATLTSGDSSYVLTRTVFDRAGRVAAVASDNTAITTYSFDGADRQILVIDALGNTTATQYDPNGNAVQVTITQVSTVTSSGPLMMALRMAETVSDSPVAVEVSTMTALIDAVNNVAVGVNTGADGTSNVCSVYTNAPTMNTSLPWGSPTGAQFTFSARDSQRIVTAQMCATGNVTGTVPDASGRITETFEVVAMADECMLSSGQQEPVGSGEMEMSARARLASAVEAATPAVPSTGVLAGGQSIIRKQTVYDANGRIVALVDARGAYTRYTYDLLDRMLTMTFQDGSTRTYVYNLAGDVVTYTDENGSVFENTYDALGRKTAVAITQAVGVFGTVSQAFQYDGLSRMSWCRDKTNFIAHVDVGFAYDSLSRVIEEGQTDVSDTRYVTHDTWTSLTSTDLTYPNGRQVTSAYDLLYRRNAISETSGGASIAQWGFTGDRVVECLLGNGLICTQLNNARTNSMVQSPDVPNPAWGDQSSDRLGYDGTGKMICKRFLTGGIDGDSGAYNNTTSLVGFTTFYDPSGNKLYERALHAESRSSIYSNDLLNRLLEYQRGVLVAGGASISTAITLPGTDSSRSYDLDGMGNWKNTVFTPVGGSQTSEVRRHNLLNQLTKFGSTPVTYWYGQHLSGTNPAIAARGNGNVFRDGANQYDYDALNRIVNVNRLSDLLQTADYTYDALGRRVGKSVVNGGLSGTITNATYRYLYDGNQIIEELLVGETTTTLRQFVWGQYIDELIQLMTYADTGTQPLAAGSYYPLQDLLYRTTALTDSGGNIVEAYDYDAYGNTQIYYKPAEGYPWFTDYDVTTLQPACEYLFTGRQYDPETEIYWYRARYYSPSVARFLQREASSAYDQHNLYEYVRSGPAMYVDPLGLTQVRPQFYIDADDRTNSRMIKPPRGKYDYEHWAALACTCEPDAGAFQINLLPPVPCALENVGDLFLIARAGQCKNDDPEGVKNCTDGRRCASLIYYYCLIWSINNLPTWIADSVDDPCVDRSDQPVPGPPDVPVDMDGMKKELHPERIKQI